MRHNQTERDSRESRFASLAIPEIPLADFVLARAATLGDKAALIDAPSGRVLTYGHLVARVQRAAAGLQRRGFTKGHVLALFSPNAPQFAVAYYAAASLGGIVTTIDPLATSNEAALQLMNSGAGWLVSAPSCLDCALQAADRAGVAEVFVLGAAAGRAQPFARLLAEDVSASPTQIDVHGDVVALAYSSGMTRGAKSVMLTHYNLVANVCQIAATARVAEDDTIMAMLPFSHINGLQVALNHCLYAGATLVTAPRLELEVFLAAVQQHAATRAYVAPPMLEALATQSNVGRYDLSSLKTIVCVTAQPNAELAEACGRRLGCAVTQAYGGTESSLLTHLTPDGLSKPCSVGPALPETQARVVDLATGMPVGPGWPGEIHVRGPQVLRGSTNYLAATAGCVDVDGWLRTGDFAYTDQDGYFFVLGRIDELINCNGYRMVPAQLEAVLISHPAVADAAVVGDPDDEAGEVPKAYLVLNNQAAPIDDILAFVAERLAPYKRIRRWEIVPHIPRSTTGTILRQKLIEHD